MLGKVTTGFQITLPFEFRQKNQIHIGDYVGFYEQQGKLFIEPVKLDKSGSRSDAVKKFEKIFAKEIFDKNFAKKSETAVLKIVRKEVKSSRKKLRNETRH